MRSVHPGGEPPPRPVICRSIKASEIAIFKFLGGWDSCILHYKSDRYTPCTGFDNCPKETHRQKMIWRGFAPCHEYDQAACRWWAVALEITENLATFLIGRDLRGEVWQIQRSESSRKESSVIGEYLETLPFNGAWWFDPKKVVENRYRVSPIQWGVGINVPAKLVMSGVDSPPPMVAQLAASMESRAEAALTSEQAKQFAGRLRDSWEKNKARLNGKAVHP